VTYELLPAVFDVEEAVKPTARRSSTTRPTRPASTTPPKHRPPHHGREGDVQQGFAEADHVFEHTYYVHQVQQAPIEPHIAISWWDADERLVIRTSTQVPFHVRRMVAPLLGLPVSRIRVIKPRIGGGFGAKQEMLIEDIVGHLTIATGRPVRLELTRSRGVPQQPHAPPGAITYKTGVMADGTLHSMEMRVLGNTGAYGTHGLTVQTVSGLRGLSSYNCETAASTAASSTPICPCPARIAATAGRKLCSPWSRTWTRSPTRWASTPSNCGARIGCRRATRCRWPCCWARGKANRGRRAGHPIVRPGGVLHPGHGGHRLGAA
jgi:CO/xanthine dehydrogenase Mo-binding subunit